MDIKILDCTLRDGGYINNWDFGENTIRSIISKLLRAKIDIIECGFLSKKVYGDDFTLFNIASKISKLIPKHEKNCLYVAMLDVAEEDLELDKIGDFDGESIDGIRLTFNSDKIEAALEAAEILKKKGYKIFLQPMKTCNYSEKELFSLIKKVNELEPWAFYIVDTFGSMYQQDVSRLFSLIDGYLKGGIKIGFHSHNNLQLSFSNAQALMNIESDREVIIDSSVFGMGRGAGNLATELLAKYINTSTSKRYEIPPLLNIYDEHLSEIYSKNPWGYSLPHFLSAVYNCHPNYSTYLSGKKEIPAEAINLILQKIPDFKKSVYDREIIEKICLESFAEMV